jgi:hypothetical protein
MAGLRFCSWVESGARACDGRKGREGETREDLLVGQGGLMIKWERVAMASM